jgi:hypothetical protein
MNHVRLTDLDELALTVRDRTSLSYIVEAINAYRGGANRAAIISTWIAVTSDIISKIRELASQSDPSAMALAKQLDTAIKSGNIPQLQKIENELLVKARDDFEFLSHHEYTDLSNLKTDRHLCAHPAFVAEETLFQPTPELVRTHIVHAVIHLLQHQPIQGKSALERIKADIARPSFPSDRESVATFLKAKYLDHAKTALVRNLVILLIKSLLKGDEPELIGKEHALIHSLVAISGNHHVIYESTMSAKLPEIVNALDDVQLTSIFRLLGADNRCWWWLDEPSRIRIRGLLAGYTHDDMIQNEVFSALNVDEFRSLLFKRIDGFTSEEKERVITESPRAEFIDIAVRLYCDAGSYRGAERLGASVLLPIAGYFSSKHVVNVLLEAKDNSQITRASLSPSIIERFLDITSKYLSDADVRAAWKAFVMELSDEPTDYYYYPELRKKLVKYGVLPDVRTLSINGRVGTS